MLKYLLLIALLPASVCAQEVTPVISPDYLKLIAADSSGNYNNSNFDSAKSLYALLKQPYNINYKVKDIKLVNGKLQVLPAMPKYLSISGTYSFNSGIKIVTALPHLQNEFVQGSNINGKLTWQGPETNEVFSYGPSLNNLEYDGSEYKYDINGRLVEKQNGNGARGYDNSIIRKGYFITNAISITANVRTNAYIPLWSLSLKALHTKEKLVLKQNENLLDNFSASVERSLGKLLISGRYDYFISNFSNDNRYGFLNHVFQSSLITPISFDNSQGIAFADGVQRSYNLYADNPEFLLQQNNHYFQNTRKNVSLTIQKKRGDFVFNIIPAFEKIELNANNDIKAGAAFFPAGYLSNRYEEDKNFNFISFASYNIKWTDYKFSSVIKAKHILNKEDKLINYAYQGEYYKYNRSSNDFSLGFYQNYHGPAIDAVLSANNKFYSSNTITDDKFFLPDVSASIFTNNIFYSDINIKLSSSVNSFCSEPSLQTSRVNYYYTTVTP